MKRVLRRVKEVVDCIPPDQSEDEVVDQAMALVALIAFVEDEEWSEEREAATKLAVVREVV